MTNVPSDLRYTKTHEWVKTDGDVVEVGVDDYAQEQLGDITYLELPDAGTEVTQGEPLGVVESVKAATDIYAPVTGEVVEANQSIVDSPDSMNSQPYDSWLVRIRVGDTSQLDQLMDAQQYQQFLDEQGG
jgi:glycine cleavage system H protein